MIHKERETNAHKHAAGSSPGLSSAGATIAARLANIGRVQSDAQTCLFLFPVLCTLCHEGVYLAAIVTHGLDHEGHGQVHQAMLPGHLQVTAQYTAAWRTHDTASSATIA